MSQPTTNVNILTDTWQNFVDKVNELRSGMNSYTVTANSTLGNTSGNCHINGNFIANAIFVVSTLSGGTIGSNSSSLPQITSANLTVTSNTFFNSNVAIANVTFTNRANTTHSNTNFFTANVALSGDTVAVSGNNLNISSNTAFSGNVAVSGNTILLSTFTGISANGSFGPGVLSSNGSAVYWDVSGGSSVTVIDSVSNTSATAAASANSVRTAYNLANAANFTAQAAYSNAISLSTAAYANAVLVANTAYANAIAFSSNATNLTSGVVPAARLNGTYSINISGTAASASAVNWTGITNAPSALTAFGSTNLVRHVSPGYTSGGQVYVQTAQPSGSFNAGDLWFSV